MVESICCWLAGNKCRFSVRVIDKLANTVKKKESQKILSLNELFIKVTLYFIHIWNTSFIVVSKLWWHLGVRWLQIRRTALHRCYLLHSAFWHCTLVQRRTFFCVCVSQGRTFSLLPKSWHYNPVSADEAECGLYLSCPDLLSLMSGGLLACHSTQSWLTQGISGDLPELWPENPFAKGTVLYVWAVWTQAKVPSAWPLNSSTLYPWNSWSLENVQQQDNWYPTLCLCLLSSENILFYAHRQL